MIKNYFKTAWRILKTNKFFSSINIFGLTIGITSFLLIGLYIFDELTFDAFHKDAERVYRIVNSKTSTDGRVTKIAGAGYQVSERAKADFPEIQEVARLVTFGRANVSDVENNRTFYEDYTMGSPSFLSIFDFMLLHGDPHAALSAPHSVIMTEETAKKYFGSTDVLGKAIRVADVDSVPFEVTGILKDFPANSSISFNLLFSESSMTREETKRFLESDWESDAFSTYLLLNKQTDASKTVDKLNHLVANNVNSEAKEKSNFILQPLKDIHFLSADIEDGSSTKGNITYIYVFSLIGLFVLFIACINYINLTTARFSSRTMEIAMRKVAGASRESLAGQFLFESFLMTGISIVFAVFLTKMVLPAFNALTEKHLALGIGTDYRILLGIGITMLIVGLLTGGYPSLFQSGQKTLSLLKSKIPTGKGSISLRRTLVVLQFSISIVMITATLVVYLQMRYVNTMNLGFEKNQLVVVDINSGKVRRGWETIKHEFAQLPQVTGVSVSSRVPGEWKNLLKVKVADVNATASEGNEVLPISWTAQV